MFDSPKTAANTKEITEHVQMTTILGFR